MEIYLSLIKDNKHRKALSRVRLSCHPLMIEKGRHFKPPLAREDRICPICKTEVEDECHFLIVCATYKNELDLL